MRRSDLLCRERIPFRTLVLTVWERRHVDLVQVLPFNNYGWIHHWNSGEKSDRDFDTDKVAVERCHNKLQDLAAKGILASINWGVSQILTVSRWNPGKSQFREHMEKAVLPVFWEPQKWRVYKYRGGACANGYVNLVCGKTLCNVLEHHEIVSSTCGIGFVCWV